MTSWSRRGVLAAGVASGLAACSGPENNPPPAPPGTRSPSPAQWRTLADRLDGRLLRPRDPAYDSVRLLENPRYDDARPLAVLRARSPRDLAAGIRFAREADLPIAVRSGGHSYPGWSSGGSPRALVLDCRGLDQVSVATDGSATVGAGARLAQVYDVLGRDGRALAAGSCATVGVAGLTLGGGVGVLTRDLGLTCDAVRSMTVVTTQGDQRTIDAEHDADLFWALRGGGGGNAVVVSSFTFQTQPAPMIESAYLQWPLAAVADVLPAWQDWAPEAEPALWSTLKGLGGTTHSSGAVLLVSATWTGPSGGLDGQLSTFLGKVPAPTVHTEQSRSYRDAMLGYAGCSDLPVSRCTTGPGGALVREAFGATSHVAYAALTEAGVTDLAAQVDAAQDSGLKEAGVSVDALGGRVRDVTSDATAFVHRAAMATVQYTATFPSGTTADADRYVRGFRSAMTPHWGRHAYVNYADASLADPQAAYFGANADRLSEVRRTWDPDRVLDQPQGW